MPPNKSFWSGKKVLITGNTGFKGAWLSLWLHGMGSKVFGISLNQEHPRAIFNVTKLDSIISTCYLDINDFNNLFNEIKNINPDIIFHLAAQPLVIESINDPLYTFNTNIIGTVNILECIRILNIKASIICTSDKCYLNDDLNRPFIEDDRLGGKDPYSASKAGAELVTYSYLKTYFGKKESPYIASVRAGNVIGCGDYSDYRIVPDIINSLKDKKNIVLRSPDSTRPWQYVLDPLIGYIILAEKLYNSNKYQGSWNFGPKDYSSEISVKKLTELFIDKWGNNEIEIKSEDNSIKEAKYLKIDSSKSNIKLGWSQKIGIDSTISKIIAWEKAIETKHNMLDIAYNEINIYMEHLNK